MYTLAAEDPDDLSTSFRYEIISTSPGNLPPAIDPANGIDYMAVDANTGDVTFHTPIDFEVKRIFIYYLGCSKIYLSEIWGTDPEQYCLCIGL